MDKIESLRDEIAEQAKLFVDASSQVAVPYERFCDNVNLIKEYCICLEILTRCMDIERRHKK